MDIHSLARTISRALLAVAAGPLLGCGDLAHTNPVDPEGQLSITIVGPTEIHSLGQEVDYTFTSVPEWHYGAPNWVSSAPSVLALAVGGGRFVSRSDGDAVLTLHLGPHSAEIHVTVSQLATGVAVRTCDGGPAQILTLGGTLPLCAFVRDGVGSPIEGQAVSLTADDPSIIELSDTVAVGRGAGTTYVRASAGAWRDSLLVTVSS